MTPREGVQSDAEAGFTGHLRPGAKPALVMVDLDTVTLGTETKVIGV